jgi:hypothetical protein
MWACPNMSWFVFTLQAPKDALYNMQLQPSGVVCYIYPARSADARQIGHDLLIGA